MLEKDSIKNFLENRKPTSIGDSRDSAVLIPLILEDGEWSIIFERRSKLMKTQPGEVSLPGGRHEEDETFKETAIRETMEELNLKRDNIEVLGELNYLHMGLGSEIRSFLGIISGVNVDKIDVNKDEVDHLFTVPLKYFLENEPEAYELKTKPLDNLDFPYHLIRNGRKYEFNGTSRRVKFYKYEKNVIWGYTADIVENFIKLYKEI